MLSIKSLITPVFTLTPSRRADNMVKLGHYDYAQNVFH